MVIATLGINSVEKNAAAAESLKKDFAAAQIQKTSGQQARTLHLSPKLEEISTTQLQKPQATYINDIREAIRQVRLSRETIVDQSDSAVKSHALNAESVMRLLG